MTAENEEVQTQSARFQQRLERFVGVAGPVVQATRGLPRLPRKQRARGISGADGAGLGQLTLF